MRTAHGTGTAAYPPVGGSAKGSARIERHQLISLEMVRSIETRENKPDEEKPGEFDLSGRQRYTDLGSFPVDPPKDPWKAMRLDLVREGSNQVINCVCDGGKTTCGPCEGRGWQKCPPTLVCPECLDGIPCVSCAETGKRPRGGTKPRPAQQQTGTGSTDEPGKRVTCAVCSGPDAACHACQGRGKIKCSKCDASGKVDCVHCSASGRIKHPQCGGLGKNTRWDGAVIRHTPHPAPLELPEQDWPTRSVRARLDSGDAVWEPLVIKRGEEVPDGVDPVHRTRLARHLGRVPDEVARGVSVRSLWLARVELTDDRHRVFYVFPGKTDLEVIRRPSQQLVHQASWIAVGALVLVVLLLVLLN
ncbi:hypothetical protein [Streptomyces sp. NPDC056244]|uniref:hypothetical protein n=1 Tax=Streptomyces sp. NPDC056244 TaxID=3345762 RepID=UPI0035DBA061